MVKPSASVGQHGLNKAPTGVAGLDEITNGGLPRGRISLVSGGPGSGKTLLAMEFLVRGAREYGDPGVFMAFEETTEELVENTASLGFDLQQLVDEGKILLDFVFIERTEFEETGEFDLEGLFVRLNHAIDSVGAKRVVLDTIETLFAGLPNEAIVRAELRRLFRWLKTKGVTAVITGERGHDRITRYGLEEYVSDCVIVLDHRIVEQISTRRLRVAKYRGTVHGTNEYPFVISEDGMVVTPITSLRLEHPAPTEHVSTGVDGLDAMLNGQGFYRGSTAMVTGTAGTGKSIFGASFARAACERGESCIYFAFEEAPAQIIRNMRSVGIDLQPYIDNGLLRIIASRPMMHGLETHLANIHNSIEDLKPEVVVMDPITNFSSVGGEWQITALISRLIDYFKMNEITALFTSLTEAGGPADTSEVGVSSLMDTWVLLSNVEDNGIRTRYVRVLKSRGMSHSNESREFNLTDGGVEIREARQE
jgi:circadian clock protein KaiC